MTNKIMITLALFAFLAPWCFGAWDNDKPADNRVWNLAAGDIRDNNDALEIGLGVDLVNVATGIRGPIFNVKTSTFGAAGDGTGDDSTEIQAALDAANTAGGGVVYLPEGTYRITTALSIPVKVHLVGDGSPQTIITPVGCDGIDMNANYIEYVHVTGLTIKGVDYWATLEDDTSTTLVGSPSTFVGIDISDDTSFSQRIRLNDIRCEKLLYGIRIRKAFAIVLNGVQLVNNKYGLYMDDTSGSANSLISGKDVFCEYNGFNIWMKQSQQIGFNETMSQFSRNHAGIYIESCQAVLFDSIYGEFSTVPGDLGVATDHPTDTPTATLIWDSDGSTGSKQFIHLNQVTRSCFRNMRMQRYRIGIYMRLCNRVEIDTIWQVNRTDLTLGAVSYNATIVNYAGSTSESVNVDNRYNQTPEPIISRHLTTASRRGGMIWYEGNARTYEANNTRTLIDETGVKNQYTTDGLTLWTSIGPTITDTVEISSAEIKDLVNNPKELIAAPGGDYVIEFLSAILIHDAGTAYVEPSAPDDMVIEYDTGTDLTASIDATGFLTVTDDEIRRIPTTLALTTDLVPEKDAAVQLFNTGEDLTTGTGTMTVKINYRIHKLGL